MASITYLLQISTCIYWQINEAKLLTFTLNCLHISSCTLYLQTFVITNIIHYFDDHIYKNGYIKNLLHNKSEFHFYNHHKKMSGIINSLKCCYKISRRVRKGQGRNITITQFFSLFWQFEIVILSLNKWKKGTCIANLIKVEETIFLTKTIKLFL